MVATTEKRKTDRTESTVVRDYVEFLGGNRKTGTVTPRNTGVPFHLIRTEDLHPQKNRESFETGKLLD